MRRVYVEEEVKQMKKQKYFSVSKQCKQMHTHPSKREANRCDELTHLRSIGSIKNLKQQPEFTLQPRFEFAGRIIRPIKYVADFSYIDNVTKKFVVEDTKGYRTRDYMIKKKMLIYEMREQPNFEFRES